MTFEYLQRVVVDAELNVDDIGQCVILGRNDIGEESYLLIRTEMGWTEQITVGPVCPDIEILPFNVAILYSRYEYNQGKIERAIDKFLNDPKKMISQAEVVTYDAIYPQIWQTISKIFPIEERGLEDEQQYTDNS
jgi:hypothetical protein